jgi:hypothetical protein
MADKPNTAEPGENSLATQSRPVAAVAALLVSLLSWPLLCDIPLKAHGAKYYAAVGFAALSTLYVAFNRKWLPRQLGRISLSPREIFTAVAAVVILVTYIIWIADG